MAITIDVKKGDTILVGKFKNKKMAIRGLMRKLIGMQTDMESMATLMTVNLMNLRKLNS